MKTVETTKEKPEGIVITLTPRMLARFASAALGISIQALRGVKSAVDKAVARDKAARPSDKTDDFPCAVIIDELERSAEQEEEEEEIHVEASENQSDKVEWKEIGTQVEEGVNSVDWEEVGEEIKESLETVDWKGVGQSIQEGLESVDWNEFGQQISEAFKEQPEVSKQVRHSMRESLEVGQQILNSLKEQLGDPKDEDELK